MRCASWFRHVNASPTILLAGHRPTESPAHVRSPPRLYAQRSPVAQRNRGPRFRLEKNSAQGVWCLLDSMCVSLNRDDPGLLTRGGNWTMAPARAIQLVSRAEIGGGFELRPPKIVPQDAGFEQGFRSSTNGILDCCAWQVPAEDAIPWFCTTASRVREELHLHSCSSEDGLPRWGLRFGRAHPRGSRFQCLPRELANADAALAETRALDAVNPKVGLVSAQ